MLRLFTTFILAIMILGGASSVAASPEATPDVLHVASWTETRISIDRLLANDTLAPGTTWSIVHPPSADVVTLSSQGDEIFLTPRRAFGSTSFSYRLQSPQGPAVEAEVIVRLVPEWQPLSGRWPLASADVSPPCKLGDGVELGFYNSRLRSFTFCDLAAGELKQCFERPAGPLPVGDGLQVPEPWLALMVHEAGSPWQRPTLVRPRSADVVTFAFSMGLSGHPDGEANLFLLDASRPKFEASAVPVDGDYFAVGGAPSLGRYDLIERRLSVPPAQPGGLRLDVSFDRPATIPEPILGNWQEQGADTLGLWRADTGDLHFLVDHFGNSSVTMGPWDKPGSPNDPVLGVAFTGRISQCSQASYLAIFDLTDDPPKIHFPTLLDCQEPGAICPPVHVVIEIDPRLPPPF